LTWESFKEIALFVFGNINSTFIYNFTKLFEIDLRFIILICVFFYSLNQAHPFNTELFENFSVNLNSFLLMHFLMKNTKVLVIFGRLPALFMITNIYFLSLGFILSKIQAFCWEHFSSNRNLKIFVGNNTVTIDIEFIENTIKFVLCNFKTPKIKIKLKFSSTNFTGFFNIEIHKSFSESFPLKHNFLKNFSFNITLHKCRLRRLFIHILSNKLLFKKSVKLWIFNRIMSKVKSFGHMNSIS